MGVELPDPYELFLQYGNGGICPVVFDSPRLVLKPGEYNRMEFSVRNPEAGESVNNGLYNHCVYIRFDLAQLAVSFSYDPSTGTPLRYQMTDAFWSMILTGPFRDRKFFATCLVRNRDGFVPPHGDMVAVSLSTEGQEIPGLIFSSRDYRGMSASWKFFVPNEDHQRMIDIAIQIHREQQRVAVEDLGLLRDQFSLALSVAHAHPNNSFVS